MTLLIDTNVIMDALQERSPFDVAAKKILKLGQNGKVKCLFTANAAADIFYLFSKARDTKAASAALSFLLKVYGVVSVTQEDCLAALSLPISDFEDALVVACATKAKADYILTRDEKFLKDSSPVSIVSPDDFLAKLLHRNDK